VSTKTAIKSRGQTAESPGFQLYADALDGLGTEDDGESPVYLRLDGVAATLQTLTGGGASVTVMLPREIARELGQLPPDVAPISDRF
jgi:hypothetical protein